MNDRKIKGKYSNTWELNNVALNNSWIREEVSREIKQYIELNVNANLQNTAKVVHILEKKTPQINN